VRQDFVPGPNCPGARQMAGRLAVVSSLIMLIRTLAQPAPVIADHVCSASYNPAQASLAPPPYLLRLRGAGRPNGRQNILELDAEEAMGATGLRAEDSGSEDGSETESTTSSSMQTGDSNCTKKTAGMGRMVRRDDIVTADQCIGHAEAAIEAGEFEDAHDFLQVALDDVADEHGKDAMESVPLLLLYSKALMAMESQDTAEVSKMVMGNAADDDGQDAEVMGNATDDGQDSVDEDESSGPEDTACAAWRALEDVRRIISQNGAHETKELADAHELQASFALNAILKCPALAGKTIEQRTDIARTHLETCLAMRVQLFPDTHDKVLRVKAQLANYTLSAPQTSNAKSST